MHQSRSTHLGGARLGRVDTHAVSGLAACLVGGEIWAPQPYGRRTVATCHGVLANWPKRAHTPRAAPKFLALTLIVIERSESLWIVNC